MQNQTERWQKLWKRLGAQGDADLVYSDLVTRYSEPHRAYHTLEHIGHCLDEFENVKHLATNPEAIEFALWYHDAFYDTKSKDNEEKSAKLARETIKNASLPDSLGQLVANLIMGTKHISTSEGLDHQLLVDIDLSILGQPKDVFDTYEQNICKEYGWVPKDAFVHGRSTVLRSFLNRKNIYQTQAFQDKYEEGARLNLARSLAKLSSRS